MRLIRLRLTHYRGIETAEVHFRPKGVTIVEGPNEVGKTSLSEAIGLIFEYMDSSKHRNVDAVRPVHCDAGPEIELEAESGPYVFVYFKRFYKKPATTLSIKHPRPENLTGREAHDRAEQILRETIDVDLWKALCIQQGEAIAQADLSKQTSLSVALDMAAGGHCIDTREEGLFDKVRQEFGRYFTDRGAEKKALQQAKKDQTTIQEEVASLEKQILGLEQDALRAETLKEELQALTKQEQALRDDLSGYTNLLNEIKRLESLLENAGLKLESARKTQQAIETDKSVRQGLIENLLKARKRYDELASAMASARVSFTQAEEAMKAAQRSAEKAEEEWKATQALLTLRRADFDYFNNKLHLEQLRERKERIDRARETAVHAEAVLAENKVDENALKAIHEAEMDMIAARAKWEAGSPHVKLTGLSGLEILLDGETVLIGKDDVRRFSVSERTEVTIPGALKIEVAAGTSVDELSTKVTEADQRLLALCRKAGVGHADEARKFFEARREAQRSLDTYRTTVKENLRDLSYEQLSKKVIGLGKTVPAYLEARPHDPELAPDLAAAKAALLVAETDVERANKAREATAADLDAARKVRDRLGDQHQKEKVARDLKVAEVRRLEEELVRSRQKISDDDLTALLKKATDGVQEELRHVRSAEAALKSKEPDRVKTLAETAQGSLTTLEKKLGAAQKEETEVLTRLKIFGEEGLHEKYQALRRHLAYIQQQTEAINRRAAAASLLYLTMKEERDKARRAYVTPLKERIESLGRLVFNDSFEVEVTENLSIAGRTLDGVTVPYESLSGGTKEQLSLISRLACAVTVAGDGGASLILDDALGYTDSERLKLMGAVLARAGKECQIIILTCVPERYSHVGEAAIARLGACRNTLQA